MARYDLTDFEWSVIEPLLRRSPAGFPGWMIAGFCWVLRSGAPWADLPGRYGPPTTCYNRFRRWTKAGIWGRMMNAMTEAYDGDIQMIGGFVSRTPGPPLSSSMKMTPAVSSAIRMSLRVRFRGCRAPTNHRSATGVNLRALRFLKKIGFVW